MTEDDLKAIAGQLRQPNGEYAVEVGEKMNQGNFHMNVAAIQALNAQPGETILEVGMGNGFFVKDILHSDASIRYHGCDFSEAMVAESIARNKVNVEAGRATFHLTNTDQLPLPDASVHQIMTINTIYFWDDPALVLGQFRRVLKPQGTLVLAIRPKDVMLGYPMTKYGFTMYTLEELKALLIKHGFQVEEVVEGEHDPQEFLEAQMRDAYIIFRATMNEPLDR